MSFYDDLKKPEQQKEPVIPAGYVLTESQRQQIVTDLCGLIRLNCTSEKKKGKRSYRGFCLWGYEARYTNDDREYQALDSHITDPRSFYSLNERYCYTCTQAERDKILSLMRKNLAADGFPPNVLQPCDHRHSGGLLFNKKMIYCIEVNVRW